MVRTVPTNGSLYGIPRPPFEMQFSRHFPLTVTTSETDNTEQRGTVPQRLPHKQGCGQGRGMLWDPTIRLL